MKLNPQKSLAAMLALLVSGSLWADALTGNVQKQATNWTAIVMFFIFVGATLWITKWAAKKK